MANRKRIYSIIYIPDKNNFKTVVWIHGGGLEEGDKNGIHFAEDLLKLGYGLVTINYRLYPNAVFPDYIIDAAKAVGYVFRHIKGYGGTGEIYVTGQSAGAYITMMLCLNDKYLKAEGIEVGQVAGFIADSAQLTTHFNVLRERGIDTRLERIEEAAPLYYLKEKMAFKRLLLIYYTDDVICRPEQNKLFYRSAVRLMPEKDIEILELSGTHVNSSERRNENGEFGFVNELAKFIEKGK